MGLNYDDFHWEMARGDTRTFTIPVVNPDTGAAINIAGATFWATAKRQLSDADPGVFQLTSAAGDIAITDAATGIATATIAPAKTSGLTAPATLLMDVQMKDSTGVVSTLTTGKLTVKLDVSQSST